MRISTDRGFTLIELIIAGLISSIVVLAAFGAVVTLQQETNSQRDASDVMSGARLALDMITRDIRSAGDSVDMLPTHCIPAANRHPAANSGCPAILEPHPWRLSLARNAWVAPGGGNLYSATATQPPTTRAFTQEPMNVVMYEFVPYAPGDPDRPWVAQLGQNAGTPATFAVHTQDGNRVNGRRGFFGRIDQIINPYNFTNAAGAAQPAIRTTILDNVVIDNGMVCNPADPLALACDNRFANTLFTYRMLAREDQTGGTDFLTGPLDAQVDTSSDNFLMPPVSFWPAAAPVANGNIETTGTAAVFAARAFLAQGTPFGSVTGMTGSCTGVCTTSALIYTGSSMIEQSSAATLNPFQANSHLRLVIDRNRIRAVRVSFKTHAPVENPGYPFGIDLDPTRAGTAPIFTLQTTAAVKSADWRVRAGDI